MSYSYTSPWFREPNGDLRWQPSGSAPAQNYKIEKRRGRLILRRDGLVIGLHQSITDLQRLAENDYLLLLNKGLQNV